MQVNTACVAQFKQCLKKCFTGISCHYNYSQSRFRELACNGSQFFISENRQTFCVVSWIEDATKGPLVKVENGEPGNDDNSCKDISSTAEKDKNSPIGVGDISSVMELSTGI